MRKYTRKPIRLGEVSQIVIRKPMKVRDEIDEQVAKLKAAGWMDDRGDSTTADEYVLENAMTYTGLGLFKGTKAKPTDKSRDVIVVKRAKGERERVGRIHVNKRGFGE